MFSVCIQNFVKDPWNVFDFVTVVGSIIEALVFVMGVSLTLYLTLKFSSSQLSNESHIKPICSFRSTDHLVQCRFLAPLPSRPSHQIAATGQNHSHFAVDICAIAKSTALRLPSHRYALLYICDYRNAGNIYIHNDDAYKMVITNIIRQFGPSGVW